MEDDETSSDVDSLKHLRSDGDDTRTSIEYFTDEIRARDTDMRTSAESKDRFMFDTSEKAIKHRKDFDAAVKRIGMVPTRPYRKSTDDQDSYRTHRPVTRVDPFGVETESWAVNQRSKGAKVLGVSNLYQMLDIKDRAKLKMLAKDPKISGRVLDAEARILGSSIPEAMAGLGTNAFNVMKFHLAGDSEFVNEHLEPLSAEAQEEIRTFLDGLGKRMSLAQFMTTQKNTAEAPQRDAFAAGAIWGKDMKEVGFTEAQLRVKDELLERREALKAKYPYDELDNSITCGAASALADLDEPLEIIDTLSKLQRVLGHRELFTGPLLIDIYLAIQGSSGPINTNNLDRVFGYYQALFGSVYLKIPTYKLNRVRLAGIRFFERHWMPENMQGAMIYIHPSIVRVWLQKTRAATHVVKSALEIGNFNAGISGIDSETIKILMEEAHMVYPALTFKLKLQWRKYPDLLDRITIIETLGVRVVHKAAANSIKGQPKQIQDLCVKHPYPQRGYIVGASPYLRETYPELIDDPYSVMASLCMTYREDYTDAKAVRKMVAGDLDEDRLFGEFMKQYPVRNPFGGYDITAENPRPPKWLPASMDIFVCAYTSKYCSYTKDQYREALTIDEWNLLVPIVWNMLPVTKDYFDSILTVLELDPEKYGEAVKAVQKGDQLVLADEVVGEAALADEDADADAAAGAGAGVDADLE